MTSATATSSSEMSSAAVAGSGNGEASGAAASFLQQRDRRGETLTSSREGPAGATTSRKKSGSTENSLNQNAGCSRAEESKNRLHITA